MKGEPIRRREFIRRGVLGSAGLIAANHLLATEYGSPLPEAAGNGSGSPSADLLAGGFQSPPATAKPRCWWHWMDGNVTKEGITADLEAMSRVGLGGAHIFNISYQIPTGSVKYLTPEWFDAMRFATQEAERLGLEVGMHNCSGWSSSGGSWIQPNHGMQKVVWSELRVKGPAKFNQEVPKARLRDYGDYYRDIALLACKTPAAECVTLREANPTISIDSGKGPVEFSQLDHSGIALPSPSDSRMQSVGLHFSKPFTASSLFLEYAAGHGEYICEVQISNDGKEFRTVARTNFTGKGQIGLGIPETTASHYRLSFGGSPTDDAPLHLTSIDLGGHRLPNWPAKAGFVPLDKFDPVWAEPCPPGAVYPRDQVVDLSSSVKSDGRMEWDVPAGDWTIFRFGYAPNGRPNTHPEMPTGYGLEVDKMSREALAVHFDHLVAAMLQHLGPLVAKTFTTLLIDSYEVGSQNWTPRFPEEFRQRRGYDLTAYLPALTGRIVDSHEATERFLWDVRRTIADLFADNYYGYFVELCHQRGLKAAFEAYVGPYSILDCSAAADLPMGEFWTGGAYQKSNARNRLVISAAHLNGRSVVGAEAFTSGFGADRFTQDPNSMKALGDWQFCEGINCFFFHDFTLQPWVDKAPGMTMGPWGLHFSRTVTWWEQGRAWIEYITRCQYLLQTGVPVADILCFTGEDAEAQSRWGKSGTLPPIPRGYDFEFIGVAALLTIRVQDGRMVLPNGLTFRLLALPEARYLTPVVAGKLSELIRAGATLVGPAPERSPSLGNYPGCDETVRRIAADLWGAGAGQGKVFWGRSIEQILADLHVPRDFAFASSDAQADIAYKHRVADTADIYFVSNQSGSATMVECQFRVTGKIPELWQAETGGMEPAPVFQDDGSLITVSLRLEPAESVFVIFRQAVVSDHAVAVTGQPLTQESVSGKSIPIFQLAARNDRLILNAWAAGNYEIKTARGRHLHASVASLPAPVSLNVGWKVSFPPKLGAPAAIRLDQLGSLSRHADAGVRYFSGTAAYTRDCEMAAADLAPTHDIYLDLGQVKNLARVKINNVDLGVLWKPPFRVCITPALQPGLNHIEIQVTNLWANRLIGDEQLPDDCEWVKIANRGMCLKEWPAWLRENKPRPSQRIAFATWKFYTKHDVLPDSGLLGPVTLHAVKKITLSALPEISEQRRGGV